MFLYNTSLNLYSKYFSNETSIFADNYRYHEDFSESAVANILYYFLKDQLACDRHKNWFYLVQDNWYFDAQNLYILNAISKTIKLKANIVLKNINFIKKRNQSDENLSFFNDVVENLISCTKEFIDIQKFYLSACEKKFQKNELIENLPFVINLSNSLENEKNNILLAVQNNSYAISISDRETFIHVKGKQNDDILTFTCPFCYEKYKQNKIEPLKKSKNAVHHVQVSDAQKSYKLDCSKKAFVIWV